MRTEFVKELMLVHSKEKNFGCILKVAMSYSYRVLYENEFKIHMYHSRSGNFLVINKKGKGSWRKEHISEHTLTQRELHCIGRISHE